MKAEIIRPMDFFEYPHPWLARRWQGDKCECELALYKIPPFLLGKPTYLVIYKPYPGWLGLSITNGCEGIATEAVKWFNLDPQIVTWVEHYPCDPDAGESFVNFGKPSYDLVEFEWRHTTGEWRASTPKWRHMGEQEFQGTYNITI